MTADSEQVKWRAPSWGDVCKAQIKLSKSKLVSISNTEKSISQNKEIVDYEESLGMIRSVKIVGAGINALTFPELMGNRNEMVIAGVNSHALMSEMISLLKKPQRTLIHIGVINDSNFYNSYIGNKIYIVNNYYLDRLENFYDKEETEFEVVDILDLNTGKIPQNLDMIYTLPIELLTALNKNLLEDLIDALAPHGCMIIASSSDGQSLYADQELNIATAKQIESNPMQVLHNRLNNIENISYFHILTFGGLTVVIKNGI